MRANCILPDEPVADFSARLTRRKAARSLASQRRSGHAGKRVGVLAAALVVALLAGPGGFAGSAGAPLQAQDVTPMGFEIAGESFPGSAFYYLEDTPQLAASEQADMADGYGEELSSEAELALLYAEHGNTPDVGLPALPLRLAGSVLDRARAQQCLTQAIYYEAASESDAGQRAVAQVVLNRVAHPSYPNTVCGVVFQGSERSTGCQFTFTCDGSMARKPSAMFWNRASRIARQALAGVVYAPVGMATHYHTLAVNPYWAGSLQKVAVIGAHQFYRWPGSAGTRTAFTARYVGGEPLPVVRLTAPEDGADAASFDYPAYDTAAFLPSPPYSSAAPAQPTSPAAPAMLPRSGSVREEYARSGSWIGGGTGPGSQSSGSQVSGSRPSGSQASRD